MRRFAATSMALAFSAFSFGADAAQGPPTPVETTLIMPRGCAFPVSIELSGKAKTITLPGGRTILTSPGLTATVTNLDNPENQLTLNITGASHLTTLENGDVEATLTGRNLVLDPNFIDLTIGRFTVVLDQAGVVVPLSGTGQRISLCELLA